MLSTGGESVIDAFHKTSPNMLHPKSSVNLLPILNNSAAVAEMAATLHKSNFRSRVGAPLIKCYFSLISQNLATLRPVFHPHVT